VPDVDRRPVLAQRPLDDLDRALDARAKTSRLGQDDTQHPRTPQRPDVETSTSISTPAGQNDRPGASPDRPYRMEHGVVAKQPPHKGAFMREYVT
jgi:hypothetical protein